MTSQMLLFLMPLLWIQDAGGQVVLTQSPESLLASTGETVAIKCQSDTDIDDDMNWYQHKSGAPPKLLFYEVSNRQPGVPARFSNSGYGTDFTFTISGVEVDDVGDYYCQQSDRTPLTVIQPSTKTSPCRIVFSSSYAEGTSNHKVLPCSVMQVNHIIVFSAQPSQLFMNILPA